MELAIEHLKELKKQLGIWERYKRRIKKEEFLASVDVQNMVLHAMYLAIQCAIDLANDLIVMHELEEPSTYREVFLILGRGKLLPMRLAKKLASLAGFRNVIAHIYLTLDLERAYSILRRGDRSLKEFAEIASRILRKRARKN